MTDPRTEETLAWLDSIQSPKNIEPHWGLPVLADAPDGAVALKFADPTEDWRWVMSMDEAAEISAIDPSLLYWRKDWTL